MPYEISWTENGVEVRFSGIFDFEVNKNANIEIYENPRCETIKYAIWDASGISMALTTEAEFSVLAMQDHLGTSRLPSLKLAMLAKDTETRRLFEFYAKYHHSQSTGWDIKVFNNMEKLRSWIAS